MSFIHLEATLLNTEYDIVMNTHRSCLIGLVRSVVRAFIMM